MSKSKSIHTYLNSLIPKFEILKLRPLTFIWDLEFGFWDFHQRGRHAT